MLIEHETSWHARGPVVSGRSCRDSAQQWLHCLQQQAAFMLVPACVNLSLETRNSGMVWCDLVKYDQTSVYCPQYILITTITCPVIYILFDAPVGVTPDCLQYILASALSMCLGMFLRRTHRMCDKSQVCSVMSYRPRLRCIVVCVKQCPPRVKDTMDVSLLSTQVRRCFGTILN